MEQDGLAGGEFQVLDEVGADLLFDLVIAEKAGGVGSG